MKEYETFKRKAYQYNKAAHTFSMCQKCSLVGPHKTQKVLDYFQGYEKKPSNRETDKVTSKPLQDNDQNVTFFSFLLGLIYLAFYFFHPLSTVLGKKAGLQSPLFF